MSLIRRLVPVAAILLAVYGAWGLVVIVQDRGLYKIVNRTFPSYCSPTTFRPECTTDLSFAQATIYNWPQLYAENDVDVAYTYIPIDSVVSILLAAGLTVPLIKEKKHGRARNLTRS